MDLLIVKLDFDSYFNRQLRHYAEFINASEAGGKCNFLGMQKAKENFRDNLFNYFIKMINSDKEQNVQQSTIDKTNKPMDSNKENPENTEVSTSGKS